MYNKFYKYLKCLVIHEFRDTFFIIYFTLLQYLNDIKSSKKLIIFFDENNTTLTSGIIYVLFTFYIFVLSIVCV